MEPVSLGPGPGGLRVRAAAPDDAFRLDLIELDRTFLLKGAAGGDIRVEVTLVSPDLSLPLLRPATPPANGLLAEAGGGPVKAHFPDLLLVITISAGNPNATIHLAPATVGGALEVTFEPEYSLIGPPGTVLGLDLPSAAIDTGAPGGFTLNFAKVGLYVNPPAMPLLAMSGKGTGLRFEIGNGNGLSGQLTVQADSNPTARPNWLENIAARVALTHNSPTLFELTGTVKLRDAIGTWIDPSISTPADLAYTLSLVLDMRWGASLKFEGSGGAGSDFLWRSAENAPSAVLGILGAYTVFAPLLAGPLDGGGSGGYVDLSLGAGLATILTEAGWVTTQQLTVLGADLVVREPTGGGTPDAVLFFDVEVEFSISVKMGGPPPLIASRHPLKVRQKAVGLRLDLGGEPKLKPVFDTLQGFALDLSDPGTFEVADPLGEFLQPDAARMARDNPLFLEFDIVTKADLGIVTIDRASVRVPVDQAGVPSLTGLGAHLNLGPIQGGGYLKLLHDGGVEGGFDASLAPPLGLRVNGTLSICSDSGLLELLVALGIEWPIPIPLANSGLGTFGLLGLLATNRRRDQSNGKTALDWLHDAGGDPGNGKWVGERGAFAVGVGAVIGTLEGGFLMNAKGMLMVELPGPRLLLMMKASIMLPKPATGGTSEGLLLAVIDISPDAISIGVVLEYGMPFLLELRAPVQTGFNFHDPADWYLDAGSVEKRDFISVRFMTTIRADGYFMIHGNGIKSPLHTLNGSAVAAGIQAALTWGPVPLGLYIKVAVGADVGISFKPILMIGRLSLAGELHLFIVSIGVSTSALLRITKEFLLCPRRSSRTRRLLFL